MTRVNERSHSQNLPPNTFIMPTPCGRAFWNSAIRPSVPWRSCLGYRHAGCLQLSHRLPPETCGLRTRPRTDVDKPRLRHRRTAIGGGISCRRPRGDTSSTSGMSHRAGHRASPKLLNILEYLIALASPRSSDVATGWPGGQGGQSPGGPSSRQKKFLKNNFLIPE